MIRRWLRRQMRKWLYGERMLVPMARGTLFDRCMQKHLRETANPSGLR